MTRSCCHSHHAHSHHTGSHISYFTVGLQDLQHRAWTVFKGLVLESPLPSSHPLS